MKKIVVPTDFSKFANYAKDMAIGTAKKTGAQVDFLHLVNSPIDWGHIEFMTSKGAELDEAQKKNLFPEVRAYLGKVKEKLSKYEKECKKENVKCRWHLKYNKSSSDIADLAKGMKADLIVMGSHGASGLKAFLGSNTQKVVRHATCPVITVKEKPNLDLKRIVFASDFEYKNEVPALKKVQEFASVFKTEVELLLINTPTNFMDEREIEKRFKYFTSYFKGQKFKTRVYNQYSVDEGILNFSEDGKPDMVAIATNGFAGLRGLIHESIAESVIKYAKIPTYTVLLD